MRKQTAGRPQTKARAGTGKTALKTTKEPAARATSKPKPQTKRAIRSDSKAKAGTQKRAKPQTKPARADDGSAIRRNRTAKEILDAAARATPFGDEGEPMPQTLALNFMDNLAHECIRHLRPRGSGKCTIPGFHVVLERKTKPQTKARPGYNPQTKQSMTVPAKPARIVVRARVGKRLRDSIGAATS